MKIVAEDVPPVTRLRKSVPPHVAAAVGMALEKLPADRFDTASAFAGALTNPGVVVGRMTAGAAASGPNRLVPRWAFGAIALGVVGLTVGVIVGRGTVSTPPPARVVRLAISLPANAIS